MRNYRYYIPVPTKGRHCTVETCYQWRVQGHLSFVWSWHFYGVHLCTRLVLCCGDGAHGGSYTATKQREAEGNGDIFRAQMGAATVHGCDREIPHPNSRTRGIQHRGPDSQKDCTAFASTKPVQMRAKTACNPQSSTKGEMYAKCAATPSCACPICMNVN